MDESYNQANEVIPKVLDLVVKEVANNGAQMWVLQAALVYMIGQWPQAKRETVFKAVLQNMAFLMKEFDLANPSRKESDC